MATKKKGKTVPCEGCRERKKKCTAGQPCERCKRLGINCFYLQLNLPQKIETTQSITDQELQFDVESLKDIMKNMENQLYSLKQQQQQQNEKNLKSSVEKSRTDLTSTWELKFQRNGGITINTNILSYSNLLKHVQQLSNTISLPTVYQPQFSLGKGNYIIRHVIGGIMRKGYFKAIVESIQLRKTTTSPKLLLEPAIPPIVQEQPDLVFRIVDQYFACTFFKRVIFHQKTFYDLFMDRQKAIGPVVYAVAAAVLTMRCRHVTDIVPYDQHMILSEYYFEQARQKIASQFDEVSLETMIVYLHLALFKANTMEPTEAKLYLELAHRIRQLLSETTFRKPNGTGLYETFRRLHGGFQDAAHFIQFVNNQRGVPITKPHQNPSRPILGSITTELYSPTPLPGESRQTVRAMMQGHYINRIAQSVSRYFTQVRFGPSDLIPIKLLTETQQSLDQVYLEEIAYDYRLSPDIFEDDLSDVEFKRRLSRDARSDLVSVAIAARYYQSSIALHEPYLPELTLKPNDYCLRAHKTCHQSAIKVVRLLEYQCMVLHSCSIPIASLLSAWDVLMRNSCLDIIDLSEVYMDEQEVKEARTYAIRCIDVLQRGYRFNGAERPLFDHYQNIQQQLFQALSKSISPTVKYWEPTL